MLSPSDIIYVNLIPQPNENASDDVVILLFQIKFLNFIIFTFLSVLFCLH